jgi:hypothetical protein
MWHSELFELFGWLVIVTAAGLLLTPWQWHHKLGTWMMPLVIRHMRLFALAARQIIDDFLRNGQRRGVDRNPADVIRRNWSDEGKT